MSDVADSSHAYSPDESVHTQGPVQQVREGNTKLVPWLMLCALLSGFAVAFSCFCFYQLTRSEREYRLLQIQQQMTNAWLARAGLVEPMDVYVGPEGNLFYKPKPKEK